MIQFVGVVFHYVELNVTAVLSGQTTENPSGSSSQMTTIQVVLKDKDLYSTILSKLFNESHGIFMTLQKAQKDSPNNKTQ